MLDSAEALGSAVAPDETFDGSWPYAARYTSAPGFQMHYVDEGRGAETLLLLHGEPTWGYLYRNIIPVLAKEHRVVVPDHMGFGKSETPAGRAYRLQDHIDNLERFVLTLGLSNITLVMHDFGGPVGMGLAVRQADRIKRIVSVNGPTPLGQPDLSEKLTANAAQAPWFSWIARAHRDGTLRQVLGQLDYTILSTLKLNGFERNEIITDTWLDAYRAPFRNVASCAGAIGWAEGFAEASHQFEPAGEAVRVSLARKPAMAIWGMADRTLSSKHFLPLFEAAFPGSPIHELDGVGHYSPEDAPQKIVALIGDFVRTS